ncbi:MAG: hypothetical protein ACXAB7_09080, partial [Candidatus Kariarchaeaceae archaeon]
IDISIPLLSVITYYSNHLTEKRISVKQHVNTSYQSVSNIIRYESNKFGVVVGVGLYDEENDATVPIHVIHLFSQSPKYLQGRLLAYTGFEYLIPTFFALIIAIISYRRKTSFRPIIEEYPSAKEIETE